MNILIEKKYPLVIALLIVIANFLFMPLSFYKNIINNLMHPVINISTIAVCFLATIKTMLITIDNKDVIRKLKNSTYYNDLLDYLIAPIKSCFILAIISAGGTLFDSNSLPHWVKYFLPVWVGILTYSTLAFYRAVIIITKILKSLN